jgi:lipopolysaccharide/colanic/teichoic acid biosynthesis glycosyltransferase
MGLIAQLISGARLKNKRKPGNADNNSLVLGEANFRAAIQRECRRAERSKRLFLLMLASFERTPAGENGQRYRREIACALAESSRETDILGWYRSGHVLGVVFTELGTAKELGAKERNETVNAIEQRMRTLVDTRWGGKPAPKISFSFHFFPEDVKCDGRLTQHAARPYRQLNNEGPLRSAAQGIKRAIDLGGATLALIGLLPVFVIVGALVKLTSKGPAFFRQVRIGRYGRQFTFLKFRSMYVGSEAGPHQEYVSHFITGQARRKTSADGKTSAYKIINDPRITPLGRFLRKMSIDELPQLLNVLKGEMSLVGPRPPLPYECDCYEVWHFRRIDEVKPGITGLWQVYGRSKTSFDEMVRLDLRYARTWSLLLDFKILLMTFRTVLSGDGAY